MKTRFLFALLFAGAFACCAQEKTVSVSDLIQDAQAWAQKNLDTNVVHALTNAAADIDEEKAQQVVRDVQRQFRGDDVLDLAALRRAAEVVAPVLEQDEATQPYATWLRTRLDYLQVADELRLLVPPPDVAPGKTPSLPLNPGAEKEREIWTKKINERPWPAAASNHVAVLKPIFIAQKIPAELVWIAEVESSFDPDARSPAGAAGLFQLMPDTAKRFGLSLWPRDQRLQPERGAAASAQYLKYLHGRFKDWRLTLAAYNCGEGTVQKLLDRYQTRNYDDIATHLPAETQLYVPKVEAVVLRREGVRLEELTAEK